MLPSRHRIDVHHHIAPPAYIEAVGGSLASVLKHWSLAGTIEDMDEGEVETAIVSVTQLAPKVDDREKLKRVARACNEYGARIAVDHPGRFGLFAALPMPHIDDCLKEIEYAMDVLKADGVCFYTQYREKWLGDESYWPLYRELNRRKAVAYVHPAVPDCCHNFKTGVDIASIEFGTDTTRAITSMVFSGAASRFPDMKMIWSHAGGTMPFLIERFIRCAQLEENTRLLPGGFLPEAQRFYYDTAQASNVVALTAAKMVIPPSHFVFGTDYPYRSSLEHVLALQQCGVFDLNELRAIDRTNLSGILPKYTIANREGL